MEQTSTCAYLQKSFICLYFEICSLLRLIFININLDSFFEIKNKMPLNQVCILFLRQLCFKQAIKNAMFNSVAICNS